MVGGKTIEQRRYDSSVGKRLEAIGLLVESLMLDEIDAAEDSEIDVEVINSLAHVHSVFLEKGLIQRAAPAVKEGS
jgi:hypothetical protein